jgi:hypothetical protein
VFSWPLAIGFFIGIFVVLAGAPTMLIVGSYMDKYSNEKKARQAAFSVEKEMEKPKQLSPEEEQELLKLGIEDGTEKSTMTWIGYKDYQEQFARKSEVEQAAFKETDAGGQPAQAQPNQQASPPAQAQAQTPPPTPQTPPAQQPATPTVVAQAEPPTPTETAPPVQAPDTTKAVAPPPMPVSLALPETPKVANPSAVVPLADERKIETQVLPVEKVGDAKDDKVPPEPLKMPPPDSKPTDEKPNELKPNEAKPTDAKPIDEKQPEKPADVKPTDEKPLEATKPEVKPPDTKPPEKTAEAKPAEAKPAQPTTPQQPTVATPPPSPNTPPQQQSPASPPANPSQQTPATQPGSTPGPPADGEKSDRESDATSIVDVPQSKWRNGRPLASKGLNVRTQRPVFDELTTISTAPANPIIEIDFDKEGVPTKDTQILQSSGSPLIDQPILDCLFRWRASGSQLTNLPEGKTLKYRIRLILK